MFSISLVIEKPGHDRLYLLPNREMTDAQTEEVWNDGRTIVSGQKC